MSKKDELIIKEIMSGRYRNHYLIYNRKSTDDENNQKNSIAYQKSENAHFASRNILPVAPINVEGFCSNGVISEKHSGFKEDNDFIITENGLVQYRIERPKFQKMIQFFSKGYFKGIVCLCWDRISRNKSDDTIIRKLISSGVDVRFTQTTYENTSSGALHMDIDSMFAQHYSRVTSEKIAGVLRKAREDGICTYKAPIGYLNQGNMENKPLDPERAPIIKRMFELYATGDWSLSDLARYAEEQGLMTVPIRRKRTKEEILAEEDDEIINIEKTSKPFNKNGISRIFSNPFYLGKLKNNDGEYIESKSHQALIDEETFYRVQDILKKKKVGVHYTDKLDLPFRGFMRCSYCDRIYTPYYKKGILYFYSRCVDNCENSLKSFNISFLKESIGDLISNLCFTEEEMQEMDENISKDISIFEEKRNKELEQLDRRKRKIREDISYLNSNKINLLKTGVYTPESLVEENTKLNDELISLENKSNESNIAMIETLEDIQKLSELIRNLMPQYELANIPEKEIIIRIIFSELYISQNVLKFKCKNGFQCFENRFVPYGGP